MAITITTADFIKKAQSIHGQQYDYSKVVYQGAMIHVDITCNTCGSNFMQRPSKHASSSDTNRSGCPHCRAGKGFGRITSKLLLGRPDLQILPATFYIIEMSDGIETFYKAGATTQFKHRIEQLRSYYPKITTIFTVTGTLKDCIALEEAHLKVINTRYTPNVKFSGWTETYL